MENQSLWQRLWQGPAKWVLGIVAGVVAGYLTKSIEDGTIAALWDWCWRPSNWPNGGAVLAVALVLVVIGAGCFHLFATWRRRSASAQKAAPPDPLLTFRGAVYGRQLWSWDRLHPPGDPQELTPLCSTDRAALIADEDEDEAPHPSGRYDPFVRAEAKRDGPRHMLCSDCRVAIPIDATLFERVPRLIQRDLKTGAWEARQREFDEKHRMVAAASGRIATAPPSPPDQQ